MTDVAAQRLPEETVAHASPRLETSRLAVGYGRVVVLGGIDLEVAPGEVYALLGRNGSGKSTLVRTLLGQQPALVGHVRLLGLDPWRHRAALMARVGVVPEDSLAPPEMTVAGLLAFRSHLDPSWRRDLAAARLGRFGVPLEAAFGRLSRGQKKQVELALALAGRPELLVLDDPTLGLDAVARRSFIWEVVEELAGSGVTVFLTTHDLAAVEGLADRVGILHCGDLVIDEPLEELKGRFRRFRVASDGVDRLAELAPMRSRRGPWGAEVVVSRFRPDAPAAQGGEPLTLEEIFAAVVGDQEEEP
jgi:ABC-2 type transport system ATP-binding protein